MKREELQSILDRVREATGPDRELSRDIWQALDTPEWQEAYIRAQEPCGCPHDQAVEYAIRYLDDVTASIDAALALTERVLPDTEDRNHTVSVWSGKSPAARIFYHQREDAAEGGWAIGALNQWEVRGPTVPLAILSATLSALIESGRLK